MKRKNKIPGFILVMILALSMILTGCQTSQLKKAGEVSAETLEEQKKDSSTDKSAQKDSKKADVSKTKDSKDEDYIDESYVDSRYDEDEKEDLSKYQEKKEKVVTSDNSIAQGNNNQTNSTGSGSGGTGSTTQGSNGGQYSDGSRTEQDPYKTDPIPVGKPNPVDDLAIDSSTDATCTLFVECSTILNNMGDLTAGKEDLVPSDGVIYAKKTVTFHPGESVFDVLLREMQNNRIHMESVFTPGYNSAYVQGINNLYEKDCGRWSGWMYCVNGWYPNYGCSRYKVQQGDTIEWHYTCDLGEDLGETWVEGQGQ